MLTRDYCVAHIYAAKPKKKTSWVYMHLQKNEQGDYNFINGEGRASFKCGVMASKFVSDRVNLLAPRRKVNEVCGKFIPKLGGNTSGVINHLRKDHNIVPPTRETEEVVGPMSLYLHKKRSTSTLKIRKTKYTNREYNARLIAKKYLPFSFFDNDRQLVMNWLQSYAEESSKTIAMGRKTVAQDMVELANEFQTQLTIHWESNEVGKVSIGLDCWTAPNRQSYFGVTASWIDEDWILRRGVIGMEYFAPPHTGQRMAQVLAKILEEYRLDVKDIMTLVCDNASNNQTMVNELRARGFDENRRLRCVLHVFNLAAKSALRVFDRPTETRGSPRSSAARKSDGDDSDEDEDREEEDDEFAGDVNEEYVQEIMNNIQDSYLPSVTNCRDFVRAVRGSSHLDLALQGACVTSKVKFNALVKDMPVRWNSTYNMIKMQKPILQLQSQFPDIPSWHALKSGDWKNLNALQGLLKVLHEGTLELSKTTVSTIPLYALTFERIIREVREYGEKQDEIAISEFGGEIANPFADSADLCSNKLINYYQFVDNPFVLVATVLDPRGKLKIYLKSSHPVVYAEKAKDALKAAFAQYSPLHESDEEEPTPFSPENNENTNEASIFDGLEETAVEQQEPVVSEVDRYLAQNVVLLS